MIGPPSLTEDQLEVLLEIRDPDEWQEPAAAWDFAKWDNPPNDVWSLDAGWVDAICDVRGFVLELGRQTNWDSILSANLDMQLDNSSGRYSVYGTRAWPRIRPGFRCKIIAHWLGQIYPLFSGYLSEYIDIHEPDNFVITLKAADAFIMLSDPIGVDYNPGDPYQWAGDRINALLDRINYDDSPRQIATGHSTMTNYLTTRTILDEIQVTAMSDGGVFFVDKDGTLVYLDRNRIYGRPHPPSQAVPLFTDSCVTGMPYAAVEPIVGEQEFGNVVTVSNVSQGTQSPYAVTVANSQSIIDNGLFLWSPSQLVICNAEYVAGLADFQLSRRSTPFYRINSFECFPIHDIDIWKALLGMRIGDPLVVQRTPPASNQITAAMICDGMRIEATPNLWKFQVRCSPGDSVTFVNYWDFNDGWDATQWL